MEESFNYSGEENNKGDNRDNQQKEYNRDDEEKEVQLDEDDYDNREIQNSQEDNVQNEGSGKTDLSKNPLRKKSIETLSSEQSFESETTEGSKRSRRTAAINQRLLMKKIASHEPVVEETEEEQSSQKSKRKKEIKRAHSVTKTDIDTFNILFGSTMGRNTGFLLAPNLQNPEQYGYSKQSTGYTNPNYTNVGYTSSSLPGSGFPNTSMMDPNMSSTYMMNPNMTNPGLGSANITNQGLVNPGLANSNMANVVVPGVGLANTGFPGPGSILPNSGLPVSNLSTSGFVDQSFVQNQYNLHSKNGPNPYYYSSSSDPGHAYSSSYMPTLVKHEEGYKIPMVQNMPYRLGQGPEKVENKHIDIDANSSTHFSNTNITSNNKGDHNKQNQHKIEKTNQKQTKLEQYRYKQYTESNKEYLEKDSKYDGGGEKVTTEQLKNPGVIYNFNEIDNVFVKKKKKVLVNMDHIFVKGLKYIKEYMEQNLKSFTGDLMGLRNMGLDNYFVDPEYFLQTGGNYSELKDDVEVANKLIESLQTQLNDLHTQMGKTQLTKINEPSVQCCSSTYSIANKDLKDKTLEYEEILEEMKDFQDLVNDEHREKRRLFKNLILGTSKYIHKMEIELNKSKSEKNKHILVLYKNISNMIDLFWKKIEKFAWEHLKKDLQQELMKKKKENLDKFIQDAIKVSINDQDRYIFKQKMKNTNKTIYVEKENNNKGNNRDNQQKEDDEEKEVQLDEDDYEITLGEEDEKMEKEDLKLEEEMESDKEEGELDALQKDLEIPIEELLKMYQKDMEEKEDEETGEDELDDYEYEEEDQYEDQKKNQENITTGDKEDNKDNQNKDNLHENLDSESSLLSDKEGRDEERVQVIRKRSREYMEKTTTKKKLDKNKEKYISSKVPNRNKNTMELVEQDDEKEVQLDEDDYEITLGEEDEKMEKEDLKLEEEMESDKEEGELDALQKDLEMPIEELLKMYQKDMEESGEEMEDNRDNEEKDYEDDITTDNENKKVKKETERSKSDDGGEEVVVKSIGKVKTPFLIRGVLRPYQKEGLGWLVSLYQRGINGVLADEMGLGKTLQAISLLAHLACVEGNWGPHIIVVPTSILLNWVMEFNKFCPGFKVLAYYGSQAERARKRSGWNRPHSFNVLIASYSTVVQDAYVLKRRVWEYMILDEAQNIKNFHSKRWQTLLTFNTKYRLLLTGTPLQNSLQELWSLMHFILPNIFTSHTQFNIWFTDPLNQALDNMYSNNPLYKDKEELENNEKEKMNKNNMELVEKLHVIFRPYLLRRLKKDVEKQMPSKYEHVLKCTLTRRQQVLYDEYISLYNLNSSKGGPKEGLSYKSMLNILMQLRKICNHPNQLRSRDVEIPIEFNINTVQLPSFFNLQNCINKADFSNYTRLNLFNRMQTNNKENNNIEYNNKQYKSQNSQEDNKNNQNYNSNNKRKEKTENEEHVSSYYTRNRQGGRSSNNRYNHYSDRYNYYYDYKYNDDSDNEKENKEKKNININNNNTNEEYTEYKSTLQFPRKYKDRLVLDSKVKKRKLNTSFGVQFLLETADSMGYGDEESGEQLDEDDYNSKHYNYNHNSQGDKSPRGHRYKKEENEYKSQNSQDNITTGDKEDNNNNKNNNYNYNHSLEDKLMTKKKLCELLLKKENSILNLNLGNKLEINKVVECYLALVMNFLFISDKVVSRPVRLYFSGESGVNFNNKQEWHMKEVTTKLFKRDDKEYFKKNLVTIEAVNSQYRLLFPSKRSLNDDCGKFRVLGPLLLKLRSEGHRCIVYTQFSKMLDILENWINFMGFTYTRLDGSTKVELRQKIINRFNENTKIFLFISSTRTGGVGITLTGADTVVFYDTDWNPAIDRQAMDRCHRIGQTKDVNVYRLISEHTVEENIWRKQLQKRKLDDLIVDQGQFDVQHNNWFSNIDTLINIFQHKGDGEDDEEIYGRKILHESAVDETQVKPTGVQSLKMLIEVEDVDDSMALKKLTKENEKINKQDFENDIINSIPGLVSYCIKFLLKYQTVTLVKQVETMRLKIQIEDYQKNQKEEEEEDEDDIYTDYTSSEGEVEEEDSE